MPKSSRSYTDPDTIQNEKSKIKSDINSVNISTIFPSMTENSLVKELVAQFLQHEGYVESVKAFAEEVKLEAGALKIGSGSSTSAFEVQEDVDAINRQRKDRRDS